MATNPQISYAAANAEANALAALLNGGKLRVYSGAIPTHADDSIASATLLCEFTMNATAFGAASNGAITANTIAAVTIATGGVQSFFRCWDSAGTTCYIQGTAGASGCDMNFGAASLVAGAQVFITDNSFTHTVVRGA